MDQRNRPITNKQRLINLSIVGLISQVGLLTLLIIVASLLAGIFLDNRLHTKPWFTIGLIIASIPVSLVVMVFVSRAAVKKIKPEEPKKEVQEDQSLGK